MKIKLAVMSLVLFLGGCGLFGNNPSSVIGKYLKLSEKQENIEAMEKLYSERAKRELGAEKILADVLSAVDFGKQVSSAGGSMPFLKPEETINGEFATVTFFANPTWAANNDKNNQSKVLLVKENGEWKIYGFGQSGEPNPKWNSIYARELAIASYHYADLMKTRFTGKTITVEGDVNMVGDYQDDDSGSISIKTKYPESNSYILCKLKTGGKAFFEKAKEIEGKNIKIRGTVAAKDSSNAALVVLDNCAVQ